MNKLRTKLPSKNYFLCLNQIQLHCEVIPEKQSAIQLDKEFFFLKQFKNLKDLLNKKRKEAAANFINYLLIIYL